MKPTAPLGATAAIAWAEAQVGTEEAPPRSDRGPGIDDWLAAYGLGPAPWCGAFLGAALSAGGIAAPREIVWVATILGWAREGSAEVERGLVAWDRAEPGDLVVFDFEQRGPPGYHAGMLVSLERGGLTVEGNTTAGKDPSGTANHCVARRAREGRGVIGCARPRWPG